jgi:transposase
LVKRKYDQFGLPVDLEEDIPDLPLVLVINVAVHWLDDTNFDAAYHSDDCDSYHSKMLTKVIIYAYTQRSSSRQIPKAGATMGIH